MAETVRRSMLLLVQHLRFPDKETVMIRTGDVIHNSITGETIRFVETAADTDGERVVIDVLVEPNGFVASAHLHPYQTEVFEVVEGELTFKLGRATVTAMAGESVTVEPGMAHKFWNATETAARFRCVISPALQFEKLLETMFGLANDGKTNKKGLPNPLRLAVIANHHFDDVRLPFPPASIQKLGLVFGSPTGRLLGYKPGYVPAEAGDVSLAI
jgi:mannose-6-phosphate isomerase-like protein (cupin superfamily)